MDIQYIQHLDATHSIFNFARGEQTNNYGNELELASQIRRDRNIICATFDSAHLYPAPECLPGSRQLVRAQIKDVLLNNNLHGICWLNGMAGTGKSSIARSIAEDLSDRRQLAASYFFSRGKSSRNTLQFYISIALQLVISIPTLKMAVTEAIRKDPDILEKRPRSQFQQLIVKPIQMLESPMSSPMVVVVDAIDECEDEDLGMEIITLIASAQENNMLPLQFLFTSRPEPYIAAKFGDIQISHNIHTFSLHDFDAQDDIRVFLLHRFNEISIKRHAVIRNDTWPQAADVETLVRRASGLFIYVATVMQFIDDRRDNPVRRLKQILEVEPKASPAAYAGLDQLYTQILDAAADAITLCKVLGVIATLYSPISLAELKDLLSHESESDDVSLTLEGLHSILFIPAEEDKPVSIYHESLRDFLKDNQRSTKYCVDLPACHGIIAHSVLNLMTTCFVPNLCALDHPDTFTRGLWYACEHWAIHLCDSLPSADLITSLEKFAATSILCWIEALSLINELAKALQFIRETNQWLSAKITDNGLLDLFHEVEQYISMFSSLQHVGSNRWRHFRQTRSSYKRPGIKIVKRKGLLESLDDHVHEHRAAQDIIVALVGPDGTGKSTFINIATRQQSARVYHGLEPCAPDINAITCSHPDRSGRKVIFVDTSGFDDNWRTDCDIPKYIANWLAETYNRRTTLTGILFFHRISESRIGATHMRYLSMLEKLCGENASPNIILTTTMWDESGDESGLRHEEQLRTVFWRSLMNNGCQMARFNNTHESAWEIINMIDINRPLKLQTEMIDSGKPLVQRSEDLSCSESRRWKRIIAKLQKMICWPAARPRRPSNDTSPIC